MIPEIELKLGFEFKINLYQAFEEVPYVCLKKGSMEGKCFLTSSNAYLILRELNAFEASGVNISLLYYTKVCIV